MKRKKNSFKKAGHNLQLELPVLPVLTICVFSLIFVMCVLRLTHVQI